LAEAEPLFSDHLTNTELAAWLAGYHYTSTEFPTWLNREFSLINEGPPKPPGSGKLIWPWPDDEPTVRFPLIERAADSLLQRGILTREQFDAASDWVKQQSFTIAGDLTTEALTKFRDELWRDVQTGTSLDSFAARVADIADRSSIGPSHLETVYRTNVQAAFRDGRETLASNPIVNEMFPYQEYLPIHDARARPEHRALESLGLNGTAVYRRDDPFWDSFTPPWGYNCRCGISLLTVNDAARKGVVEAQEWLTSGQPPLRPEYRWQHIPFPAVPGFGSRGRVVGAA
jgi:SPP1 gp7 family putative phage head morphogenesis protein